ncbi:cell division cycle 20.1, cofactor of APC complex-like [Hibiscus syriacus]|uniref:Cell division cycle 20.1, cofactor of APC complex-like n=1 Tax=Hibiscus syriacus TaxID=106335 RepID=A0A6A2ZLE2_HIBSY|nr:cell division cycle 20.1, cofactor of APC complex-like [Hibiscus syriacus]
MLTPWSCRFTFVIAFLLLLTGSALNDQHGEESVYFGYYYCYVIAGVFAGGSALAIASVVSGILYYLTSNTTKDTSGPWGTAAVPNQGGIAMGQPQFPPHQTSQDPVFVHEDTYNRRQFT